MLRSAGFYNYNIGHVCIPYIHDQPMSVEIMHMYAIFWLITVITAVKMMSLLNWLRYQEIYTATNLEKCWEGIYKSIP